MPQPRQPAAPPLATPAEVRRALARAERGAALDLAEAAALLAAHDEDLDRLCAVAARVRDAGLRDAGRPGVVTYSPKVFIPLTRLCRDRCHYCTFVTVPGRLSAAGAAPYLSPDEVVDLARRGAELGCLEALFTLGDRPEDRWPQAREWLEQHGYDSTVGYLRAMAVLVLEETGLLPHLNPGVLSWEELARLKPVAPSLGMMLETTSTRLFAQPGQPHHGSPDKDPAVRLRVLDDAGRLAIPFTTGLLVGIGETLAERAETIFALRATARRYGAVQEVIVQGFRAKPDTAMRHVDDLGPAEYLAAVAVARIVLGPRVRLQAPPNLVAPDDCRRLLAAGVDDWGGVSPLTPDHVNPERPWPAIDRLRTLTEQAGMQLRARLTVHPEYVRIGEPWLDARVARHVAALAAPDGLARPGVRPAGLPWQEPDGGLPHPEEPDPELPHPEVPDPEAPAGTMRGGWGRTELHREVDETGRTRDRRSDFDTVYGDWDSLREIVRGVRHLDGPVLGAERPGLSRRVGISSAGGSALKAAERDPAGITDEQALMLMSAEGDLLRQVCRLADDLRRQAVGDEVTYVVNRNINFSNICYVGCRFCAFAQRRTDADAFSLSLDQVADRAEEAWDLGATEVCMQGGIDPQLPATAYLDLASAVKQRVPRMHLHAFSPMEIVSGATRAGLSVGDFLVGVREAGLDSIPGTAAEILDDDVRWVLTKGKLPTSTWVEVVTTAHRVGLPSSATMMYGHVDHPRHWVAHLRLLRRLQEETGGFTEFVPLPFVHHSAPLYLAGIARPGPTQRDNLAVHAMARILLHGAIDHIQTSWVKLGVDGTRQMLRAGADDLGGTLMEETISRMAGSEHGSSKTVSELVEIGAGIGRPVRQRTTTYAEKVPAAGGPPAGVAPDR